jgi:hypothetical protein
LAQALLDFYHQANKEQRDELRRALERQAFPDWDVIIKVSGDLR